MKRKSYVAWGFLLLGVVIWFIACSQEYSSAAFSAQVVDAETKQPLPDVNVVAHWQFRGGLEGGTRMGALMVMEAVTDASGRFSFHAWGPKRVYSFPSFAGIPRIGWESPELIFFKSGYRPGSRANSTGIDGAPPHMQSDWDGKVIPLNPNHKELGDYVDSIRGLSSELLGATAAIGEACPAGVYCPAACQWEHMPRMIESIRRQQEVFGSQGIDSSFLFDQLVDNDSGYRNAGCKSPKALLERKSK